MVLLSIFFDESDPRRDHQQIVLIHFVAPCACSSILKVPVLLKSFCMEDLHATYIHLSVVFPPRMPAGPHLLLQPILL